MVPPRMAGAGAEKQTAKLSLPEARKSALPVIVGTEDEHAVDIRSLRSETGYITLDSGFMNTGSTTSAITFLDGEQGILRYRGYPIEELAEKLRLRRDQLPAHQRRAADQGASASSSRTTLTRHSLIHEDMHHFFAGFPPTSHPMAVLSAMVTSLSAYYPD